MPSFSSQVLISGPPPCTKTGRIPTQANSTRSLITPACTILSWQFLLPKTSVCWQALLLNRTTTIMTTSRLSLWAQMGFWCQEQLLSLAFICLGNGAPYCVGYLSCPMPGNPGKLCVAISSNNSEFEMCPCCTKLAMAGALQICIPSISHLSLLLHHTWRLQSSLEIAEGMARLLKGWKLCPRVWNSRSANDKRHSWSEHDQHSFAALIHEGNGFLGCIALQSNLLMLSAQEHLASLSEVRYTLIFHFISLLALWLTIHLLKLAEAAYMLSEAIIQVMRV